MPSSEKDKTGCFFFSCLSSNQTIGPNSDGVVHIRTISQLNQPSGSIALGPNMSQKEAAAAAADLEDAAAMSPLPQNNLQPQLAGDNATADDDDISFLTDSEASEERRQAETAAEEDLADCSAAEDAPLPPSPPQEPAAEEAYVVAKEEEEESAAAAEEEPREIEHPEENFAAAPIAAEETLPLAAEEETSTAPTPEEFPVATATGAPSEPGDELPAASEPSTAAIATASAAAATEEVACEEEDDGFPDFTASAEQSQPQEESPCAEAEGGATAVFEEAEAEFPAAAAAEPEKDAVEAEGDDDDDGFGDFADAWADDEVTFVASDAPAPAAVAESLPAAATPASGVPTLLSMDTEAFLQRAIVAMASFAPPPAARSKGDTGRQLQRLVGLAELELRHPTLLAVGGAAAKAQAAAFLQQKENDGPEWKGSPAELRMMHRLNLGPTPPGETVHASTQPPARRIPSASGFAPFDSLSALLPPQTPPSDPQPPPAAQLSFSSLEPTRGMGAAVPAAAGTFDPFLTPQQQPAATAAAAVDEDPLGGFLPPAAAVSPAEGGGVASWGDNLFESSPEEAAAPPSHEQHSREESDPAEGAGGEWGDNPFESPPRAAVAAAGQPEFGAWDNDQLGFSTAAATEGAAELEPAVAAAAAAADWDENPFESPKATLQQPGHRWDAVETAADAAAAAEGEEFSPPQQESGTVSPAAAAAASNPFETVEPIPFLSPLEPPRVSSRFAASMPEESTAEQGAAPMPHQSTEGGEACELFGEPSIDVNAVNGVTPEAAVPVILTPAAAAMVESANGDADDDFVFFKSAAPVSPPSPTPADEYSFDFGVSVGGPSDSPKQAATAVAAVATATVVVAAGNAGGGNGVLLDSTEWGSEEWQAAPELVVAEAAVNAGGRDSLPAAQEMTSAAAEWPAAAAANADVAQRSSGSWDDASIGRGGFGLRDAATRAAAPEAAVLSEEEPVGAATTTVDAAGESEALSAAPAAAENGGKAAPEESDGWGEDEFDDFCEAAAPAENEEAVGEEQKDPLQEEAEQLAAQMPDLSFMLSNTLTR